VLGLLVISLLSKAGSKPLENERKSLRARLEREASHIPHFLTTSRMQPHPFASFLSELNLLPSLLAPAAASVVTLGAQRGRKKERERGERDVYHSSAP
jgi:hypothetical protein